MIGIVGYGAYLPRLRIKAHEIAKVWGEDGDRFSQGLGVMEKTVPALDEDTATISVEAARNAMRHANVDPADIGAIYVGSESHPYAVKPTATIVAAAIGATPDMTAADLEFACKAGTAGIQICMGLVGAGMIKYGMAIGADTSQGKPGDALEYTASAGGAAYVIGGENLVAEILHTCSYTTDTPDFWRREGQDFPQHGFRFTGEPAYFRHVTESTKRILDKSNLKPSDFKYVVFHQPNGKFPREVGRILGFTKEQLDLGLLTPVIGNTYSGSSPLGLARVLDEAVADDLILVTSYGSGAGSDSFVIKVKKENESRRNQSPVKNYIENKSYVEYAIYSKLKGKIKEVRLEK